MGRPAKKPTLDDFGTFLNYRELGSCLGMSYGAARLLVERNAIPSVKSGVKTTIHRAVAEQIINGTWWTNMRGGKENDGSIRNHNSQNGERLSSIRQQV